MTAPWIADYLGVKPDATRVGPQPLPAPPVPTPSVRGVSEFGPTVPRAPENWFEAMVQRAASPIKDRLQGLRAPAQPLNQEDMVDLALGVSQPMSEAAGLTGAKLLQLLKSGNGFTIDPRTGKAIEKGFSVGAGDELGHLIKKPVNELTPAELDQFLGKVPAGHALGGWVDKEGTAYVEPTNVLKNQRKAFELALGRGEKAFGHLDAYVAGENGDKLIPQAGPYPFMHYSDKPGIAELDPAFGGTGPAVGRERVRTDRVKAIHVYKAGQRPEPLVIQSAGHTYQGTANGLMYDLDHDPAGLLESMTATQMEKYLKKSGFQGYESNGTALLFNKTPVEYQGYTRLKGKGFKFEPATAPVVTVNPPAMPAPPAGAGPLPDQVPQLPLPRAPVTPAAEAEVAKAVKGNWRKMLEATKRGMDAGGLDWYNLEPIRQGMINEQGREAGEAAFTRFTHAVAATSPMSDVAANIRRASVFAKMMGEGTPLPRTNPAIAEILGPGYGHIAHNTHLPALEDIARSGSLASSIDDILARPKTSSFGENLRGNYRPGTIDRHAARMMGLEQKHVQKAYAPMEDALFTLGDKLGIPTAPAQASLWIGGADKTGVKDARPFMGIIRGMAEARAKALGMDPDAFWQAFLAGKLHF